MEMGDNHRGCKIALWNARSIRGKTVEFRERIREYDLMGVTETWLTPRDTFGIKGYNIYRRDREITKRGGGIGIVIKNDINMMGSGQNRNNGYHTVYGGKRNGYYISI